MMYHLFQNSIWKVVRIAQTSDCIILWRVFLQGTVAVWSLKFGTGTVLSILHKNIGVNFGNSVNGLPLVLSADWP